MTHSELKQLQALLVKAVMTNTMPQVKEDIANVHRAVVSRKKELEDNN